MMGNDKKQQHTISSKDDGDISSFILASLEDCGSIEKGQLDSFYLLFPQKIILKL
jgi:hypothetical protein